MARRAAAERRKPVRARRVPGPGPERFELLRRWCVVASGGFTALGVVVALGFGGALLGPWETALGARFHPSGPTPELLAVRDFLYGPLGATMAGRWVLMAWLFHEPFRRRERWAWRAAAWSLWGWFALETAMAAWQRAWFDLALVAVWPALLVGVPLHLLRDGMKSPRG